MFDTSREGDRAGAGVDSIVPQRGQKGYDSHHIGVEALDYRFHRIPAQRIVVMVPDTVK